MNIQARAEIDLTIRSFAYVARKLAETSGGITASTPHAQLVGAAEKHRSALRLLKRDVIERAEQGVRKQALSKEEFRQLREAMTQAVTQAQEAITSIMAQYAAQKLAA